MTVKPSSQEASRRLSKIRQKGTDAEMAVRQALSRMGLRYRVNYLVLKVPRRVADIVFPRLKIAVFVDGCFWHGCPEHASWPKSNADFWRNKIDTNRKRDSDTNDRLMLLGWSVMRIWEHELPQDAAKKISEMVSEKRAELKSNTVIKDT
jgi:DNA mismatch endonuclease, patch repair protein